MASLKFYAGLEIGGSLLVTAAPALLGRAMEKKIVAFVKDRIASMGLIESGAYEYYAVRVGRGTALGAYETPLLERILRIRPSRVVHVGVGLGALDVMLAAKGVQVVGYEHDRTRFAGAVALREEMGDPLGMAYDLRCATFPDGTEGSGGLLLFTDVGSGWTAAQEKDILGTFKHFDNVILDLARFGRSRDEAQRKTLSKIIAKHGKFEPLETCHNYFFVQLNPRLSFRPPN